MRAACSHGSKCDFRFKFHLFATANGRTHTRTCICEWQSSFYSSLLASWRPKLSAIAAVNTLATSNGICATLSGKHTLNYMHIHATTTVCRTVWPGTQNFRYIHFIVLTCINSCICCCCFYCRLMLFGWHDVLLHICSCNIYIFYYFCKIVQHSHTHTHTHMHPHNEIHVISNAI